MLAMLKVQTEQVDCVQHGKEVKFKRITSGRVGNMGECQVGPLTQIRATHICCRLHVYQEPIVL